MPFIESGELIVAGLSPRLRGNLFRDRVYKAMSRSIPAPAGNHAAEHGRRVSDRSIPAPAGEPLDSIPQSQISRVYPRACGGTSWPTVCPNRMLGLSPRLRGNHLRRVFKEILEGSIPAPAGEPTERTSCQAGTKVYPRACGGTGCFVPVRSDREGLSPRLRGNQGQAHVGPGR